MQPYPNIVRKLRLSADCDKTETGCTRASAALQTRSTFAKSVMVSMGVSKGNGAE